MISGCTERRAAQDMSMSTRLLRKTTFGLLVEEDVEVKCCGQGRGGFDTPESGPMPDEPNDGREGP